MIATKRSPLRVLREALPPNWKEPPGQMYVKVGEDGKQVKSLLGPGKWVLTPICRRMHRYFLAINGMICLWGFAGFLMASTNHDRAQALLLVVGGLFCQVCIDADILRMLPKHNDVHKDLIYEKK